MKLIRLFPIILLVLVAFFEEVSSESRHLSGHDDLFEDAILEHLRDIRDEEEENEAYYGDPDDEVESQDEQEERLTKDQLMQVLDVIKKEAHKRLIERKRSEKELTTETRDKKNDKHDENRDSKDKKDSRSSSPLKKDSISKKDELKLNVNKRADSVNTNVEPVKVKRQENDQVASVEFDNSIEKENELINNIDLRDVLGAKDEEDRSTNPPKPAHIKQENVVSTKANKAGLDHVSFIAVVAGCCVAAIAGLALAAYCWYKLRVETKEDVEDPKTSKKSSLKKSKDPKEEQPLSKDEEMNRNAEYYNYQHAKNQIKQLGQPIGADKFGTVGGDETTDDEEDDDNTVYECPGPGAPGDMKVVNPMFSDGESRHSDKTSHDGSPTPPNERVETVTNNNNNQ